MIVSIFHPWEGLKAQSGNELMASYPHHRVQQKSTATAYCCEAENVKHGALCGLEKEKRGVGGWRCINKVAWKWDFSCVTIVEKRNILVFVLQDYTKIESSVGCSYK